MLPCIIEKNSKFLLLRKKNSRAKDTYIFVVSVEDRNVPRVIRWLKCRCRVEASRSGRMLRDVTKALGFDDVAKVLEEYRHVNEFVCSTFSCDTNRMRHYLALGEGKSVPLSLKVMT